VIAKLRSSGSEIRKLQEVGRGLRLPFDETGTRVTPERYGEDFRLTYIIDYSENEFARKLVGEINADGGKFDNNKISDFIYDALIKCGYAEDRENVMAKLLIGKIIDAYGTIKDMKKLLSLLPDDGSYKVKNGVITGSGMPERPKVYVNKENFNKIKDLWEKTTKRHLLKFEKINKNEIEKLLLGIFTKDKIFVDNPDVQIVGVNIKSDGEEAVLSKDGYKTAKTNIGLLTYGDFLKLLAKNTSLPVSMIHKVITEARQGKDTAMEIFNTNSLDNILKEFEKVFTETYNQKFSYLALDYTAQTSLFKNGELVYEINQNDLGANIVKDFHSYNNGYLYDKAAYDSPIEQDILKAELPEEVSKKIVVYGKLPRRSIKLPTYTGGTTSPDFVYTVSGKTPQEANIHFIVETKSENPRLSDKIVVAAQKEAFKIMGSNIKWEVITDVGTFCRELENLTRNK
jgi:type III restriction enzyme